MKHQVLSSPKNNKKIFINVVSCSCDWRFKGLFHHDHEDITNYSDFFIGKKTFKDQDFTKAITNFKIKTHLFSAKKKKKTNGVYTTKVHL